MGLEWFGIEPLNNPRLVLVTLEGDNYLPQMIADRELNFLLLEESVAAYEIA
jgi:hypothetical protein